jgi:hypothetical protein
VAVLLMSAPDFTPRAEKAFSFAQEVAKQLITLSTGIFAITLTFLKDAAGPHPSGKSFLEIAWGCYLVSIVCGVLLLMALAGNLERPQSTTDSIYSRNIKLFACAQIILFLAALVLTLSFGLTAT